MDNYFLKVINHKKESLYSKENHLRLSMSLPNVSK